MTSDVLFAFMGTPFSGPVPWIIIGLLALLFFGNRLPSVMRSLGRSIVEFKQGIKEVKEETGVDGVVRTVNEEVIRPVQEEIVRPVQESVVRPN